MQVYTLCVDFKIWQDDHRPGLWQGEGYYNANEEEETKLMVITWAKI